MQPDPSPAISKRAEQGLRFQLRKLATDRCQSVIEAYVACTRDKTLSLVWECRQALEDMNGCLRRYNNERTFAELKRRWVVSGQSRTPDWEALLENLVP